MLVFKGNTCVLVRKEGNKLVLMSKRVCVCVCMCVCVCVCM